MEDCNICYQSRKNFFKGSCGHSLCVGCFRQLLQNKCPFCRKVYNKEELEIKNYNKNLNKYKQYPPIMYYRNQSLDRIRDMINSFDHDREMTYQQIAFSGYERQMNRKKRRNLTFEEIKEKRRIVKKREKRKWMLKNGRLDKIRVN